MAVIYLGHIYKWISIGGESIENEKSQNKVYRGIHEKYFKKI